MFVLYFSEQSGLFVLYIRMEYVFYLNLSQQSVFVLPLDQIILYFCVYKCSVLYLSERSLYLY